MWRCHRALMSIVARLPGPVLEPASHRVLVLDAQRVLRHLRDHPRDAGLWGEPAFAREVDRIRHHLAPIASQRLPLLSFFLSHLVPARAAYAVRWLELGDGRSRPGWSELVAGPA